ncbi:TetR-like C-terminal domain-containing protein [Roseovarius sp. D0-M9]|uniref:TetR-like C-terminal domain-containing protein n=1 Tax=Roseovarius sp. D0-M9 TaxID=3127117 RepID=UPI00300FBFED
MERKSIDDKKRRRKPSGAAIIRPELTTTLFRALFEEWAETGYTGISLEHVAARAGAGKAAIYRRWPSKLEFACDAIQSVEVMWTGFTDKGSFQADVREYLRATLTVLRHPLVRRIIADMVAERLRSSELSTILDGIVSVRRQFGHRMLDRAIARNELSANLDRELALDHLVGPLYMGVINRGISITRADLEKHVVVVNVAIKAC